MSPNLGMIWTEDQPPDENKCYVEHTSAHHKPQYTRQGQPQGDEKHVVLVQVAEEAKAP